MTHQSERIYDELLVLRCQDGDRDAMATLVKRWQQPLERFATFVARDPDLGREAVQEAWLSIIRGLARLEDPARYRQWMFRIVHNKCMDLLRVQRRAEGDRAAEPVGRAHFDHVENVDQV
ncbi:MAG: hypothetical protein KDI19_13480, partial [Pseudomonadales bacterium]|nr:hypothetical protein [Pseudomonadales bacterium]